MSTMNLKPAFRYRLRTTTKTVLIFLAIMVAVMLILAGGVFIAASRGGRMSGSFSVFGVSAAITMFVVGITTIREDIRLMLQNGVGRRTAFAAGLLAVLIASVLLAAAGELFLAASQAVTTSWQNLYITDIMQMIFFNEMGEDLTFGAHLQSAVCFVGLYLCTNLIGTFISLVFFRLNKAWSVVVAVGTPLFFFACLPILIAWGLIPALLGRAVIGIFKFSLSAPWKMLVTFAATAVVIAVCNWLLIRRAPVKPAK